MRAVGQQCVTRVWWVRDRFALRTIVLACFASDRAAPDLVEEIPTPLYTHGAWSETTKPGGGFTPLQSAKGQAVARLITARRRWPTDSIA